jgi:hypothetical protein
MYAAAVITTITTEHVNAHVYVTILSVVSIHFIDYLPHRALMRFLRAFALRTAFDALYAL